MERPDEFQEIGKKLPYSEPVGFFDGLSEKTLGAAKSRNRTRKLILWRSVAVAASLIAVVLLGFLFQETTESVVVREIQNVSEPVVQEPEQQVEEPQIAAEVKKEIVAAPVILPSEGENVSDVLADLTDEELEQLAAMIKTDPFIEEAFRNN